MDAPAGGSRSAGTSREPDQRSRLRVRKTALVRHCSIIALFGVTLVLVSNTFRFNVVGGLCLALYERPRGIGVRRVDLAS
jgi:hypothetical protein